MIEHVDVVQVFHHLCYHTIAIVVHVREILWASLSIQATWIHNLNVAVVLIETSWHVRLIIAMHHGIHHQFSQYLVGIVTDILFPQDTDGNRALCHNAVANEVLQIRQHLVKTSFKTSFVKYHTSVRLALKAYKLYICSWHEVSRIVTKHNKCCIRRTFPAHVK